MKKYILAIAFLLGIFKISHADDQRWIVYTATQAIDCGSGGYLTTRGADTFCSTAPVSGGGGGSSSYYYQLLDVSTAGITVGSQPCYSGTLWVMIPTGGSCSFSIASFSDGQAGTIEEGVGIWKTAGSLSFSASYNNGPATGGFVSFSGWSNLTLTNTFQGPTATVSDTNFPSVGGTVVFTLHATNGSSSPTSSITHSFNNDRYYGISTLSSGWSSSQILAFGTNDLVNSIPHTFTVTAGGGQYIVNAYPSRLGTSTYSVGGFAGGFNGPFTVSVTNASGFTENYFVYSSVNSNLGNTTVTVTAP